jgi:predicted nucleic acid-binding protein
MICLDASIGAKWVLKEMWADRAEALVEFAIQSGQTLVAPPLYPLEVANVLRKRMLRFGKPVADAEARMDGFLAFPVTRAPVDHLHGAALRLCERFGLPAVYDAYYVLLAQQFACELWADDQRLLNALNHQLPFVRWIGDFR